MVPIHVLVSSLRSRLFPSLQTATGNFLPVALILALFLVILALVLNATRGSSTQNILFPIRGISQPIRAQSPTLQGALFLV